MVRKLLAKILGIKTLEEFEARKEVSEDELDEFFDERGF